MTERSPSTHSLSQLIDLLNPLVKPLGYEIVHLEVISGRQKTLRVFIDRTEENSALGAVGIEDCVKATRALDEPLDQMADIEKLFQGSPYELEVSSPGVDRPLRTPRDFERFAGREIRIHVYRPLTADELKNAPYQSKNPKQKNFLGKLKGFRKDASGECVMLDVSIAQSKQNKKSNPKKTTENGGPHATQDGPQVASSPTNSADEVSIPLPLIAKANLEPKFELDFAKAERE